MQDAFAISHSAKSNLACISVIRLTYTFNLHNASYMLCFLSSLVFILVLLSSKIASSVMKMFLSIVIFRVSDLMDKLKWSCHMPWHNTNTSYLTVTGTLCVNFLVMKVLQEWLAMIWLWSVQMTIFLSWLTNQLVLQSLADHFLDDPDNGLLWK